MNLYLIYSENTIWITNDFQDKDSGYSIKYDNVDEMINEFRQDLQNGEYDYVDLVCEECDNDKGETFYLEMTKNEASLLI